MSKKPGNGKPKDFMTNTRTMSTEGMKMIRNIAFGKFNIYNEGHVFRNPELCNAIILEVDKRLFDAQVHVNAVQFAYPGNPDPRIATLLMNDQKKVEAYTLIREMMAAIVTTGDTGFLYTLATRLPKYKYNI